MMGKGLRFTSKRGTSMKSNMAMENHHVSIGDTSSSDWFSIVM